ncbi:asparagine N-glycosylation enzyme membrane subunit Stt3 [Paenibacillus wynnii]|nr:asparagine N-glycosylation enzyme membrane subunit Stt3 [Paenibacillus wynnii]
MMIRLRNLTLFLGILMALISLILFGANFAFFIILTYSVLLSVGYKFIKTNVDIIPLLTITISFLLYNIIYIILKKADVIDL